MEGTPLTPSQEIAWNSSLIKRIVSLHEIHGTFQDKGILSVDASVAIAKLRSNSGVVIDQAYHWSALSDERGFLDIGHITHSSEYADYFKDLADQMLAALEK